MNRTTTLPLPEAPRAVSSGGNQWNPSSARTANKLRVALLTNQIPPYRVPEYRQLALTPGWDFQVFTCVDREHDRQWNVDEAFPFVVRRSTSVSYVRKIRREGLVGYDDLRQVHIPLGLPRDLWQFDPNVIISSELGARTLIAAAYARLRRRPLIAYFEGTLHTEREIRRAQRCLRRLLRRIPNAFLVTGRQGKAYVQSLGVPAPHIFEIGQATETELFRPRLGADERKALRDRLGIQGHCYLFCGRLIPLKGLEQLLPAWEEFCRKGDVDATLVLVGDGNQRAALERRVADAGLNNVRFLGHVQRHELPLIYQAADVVVFPTLVDCWGCIVEEAMASGLPIINSIYAGSAERIVEGETGWLVDPLNHVELVYKLRLAWEARDRKTTMGERARQLSADMSVEAVAERIRHAVRFVGRQKG